MPTATWTSLLTFAAEYFSSITFDHMILIKKIPNKMPQISQCLPKIIHSVFVRVPDHLRNSLSNVSEQTRPMFHKRSQCCHIPILPPLSIDGITPGINCYRVASPHRRRFAKCNQASWILGPPSDHLGSTQASVCLFVYEDPVVCDYLCNDHRSIFGDWFVVSCFKGVLFSEGLGWVSLLVSHPSISAGTVSQISQTIWTPFCLRLKTLQKIATP